MRNGSSALQRDRRKTSETRTRRGHCRSSGAWPWPRRGSRRRARGSRWHPDRPGAKLPAGRSTGSRCPPAQGKAPPGTDFGGSCSAREPARLEPRPFFGCVSGRTAGCGCMPMAVQRWKGGFPTKPAELRPTAARIDAFPPSRRTDRAGVPACNASVRGGSPGVKAV